MKNPLTLSNTNDRITLVADNCIELFDNNKNLFDCNLAEKLKTKKQKKLKKLLTNETPHDNISELRVKRTTTKQTSKRMTDEP